MGVAEPAGGAGVGLADGLGDGDGDGLGEAAGVGTGVSPALALMGPTACAASVPL